MPNSVSCSRASQRRSCGHFSKVSGSRVGIAQRSHGWSSSSSASPTRMRRPSQRSSANASASRRRWRFVRKRRRSTGLRELALEGGPARLDGDEQRVGQVRHQGEVADEVDRAAEVVAQRPGQRRIVPGEGAPVRRRDDGKRRRVRVEVGAGRLRVRRAPLQHPRHLADRQAPALPAEDPEQRLRAVAARAARIDPQGVDRFAGERFHGPAVQRHDGSGGDHGPRSIGEDARPCQRSSSSGRASSG